MWPANLTSVFDYLQIDIVEFIPIAQATSTTASNTTTPSAPVSASSITSGIVSIAGGLINGGLSNVQLSNPQADVKQTVLLPVPENLNYTDALKWNEVDIGVMGKMLPGLAAGVLGGDAGGATNAIQNLAKGGKIGVILEAIKSMGLNANAITQGIGGKIANPYTEQIFEGINMRNFDLSWKLVPRSQPEQIKIYEMIKEIRKYALPNYSGTLGGTGLESNAGDTLSDRWLEVPYIFRLSWKKPGGGELVSLPKIKPCVLKNIQVSYTPDNVWATHMVNSSDPYPVAYNITMNFTETEIITRNDVESGY
jgi:hypothetical protein